MALVDRAAIFGGNRALSTLSYRLTRAIDLRNQRANTSRTPHTIAPKNLEVPSKTQHLEIKSAPGGIRTPNLLIRSQMLYPLSYGRKFHQAR